MSDVNAAETPDAQLSLRQAWNWAPWLASLAVVSITLTVMIRLSTPELVGRYMADDAFYYLVIADNFPAVEFSAGVATTGFHPLWWILLSPVAASGVDAVRAVLFMALALHIASGFVLRRFFVRRWSSTIVANLAAAVWIVHPGLRAIALFGVESSLVALVLSLLMLSTTWEVDNRTSFVVGGIVALAFLARTDSLVIAGPVAAVWSWRSSRHHVYRVVAGACVVATPWLLVLIANGGLRQDSSAALAEMRRQLGSFGQTTAVLDGFIREFSTVAVIGEPRAWLPSFVVIALIVTLILTAPISRYEYALVGGTVTLHALQAHELGAMREWYAVYLLFAVVVLAAPRLVIVMLRAPTPTLRKFAPEAAAAAIIAVGVYQLPPRFPQEQGKWEAAAAASELLPAGARVAAFNAGIYQWVMPQDVINLDGVVNPDVLPHIKDHSVCDYVVGLGVEFVIDSGNGYLKASIVAPGLLDESAGQNLPTTLQSTETLWVIESSRCE